MTTYGYKRQIAFAELLAPDANSPAWPSQSGTAFDFSSGKLIATDNASDLAVSGEGFFTVRSSEELLYTRQGQFQRDGEGRLVTARGYALQIQGGGDLVLRPGDFEITTDGVVVQNGEAIGKLALMSFGKDAGLTAMGDGAFGAPATAALSVQSPSIRQGMLEASNVSTGEEMVAIMEALRRAEAGQKLINVYDDLMGRALTTFGQS